MLTHKIIKTTHFSFSFFIIYKKFNVIYAKK